MSLSVEALEYLAERGLSLSEVIEFARIQSAPKDRTAAERQARHRAKVKAEREGDAVTRDVTRDSDGVTPPSLSRPPNEINSNPPTHTHPDNNTRAREAADFHVQAWLEWREVHPFPRPWWADKRVWSDWLEVRKAKKARNTITAHNGFLRDIAKHADAEWPPGRLLEHAVARSWLSINRPEERPRYDRLPARRTDLLPSAGTRGNRPNPCLDMLYAAEAEIRAGEDPQPDFGARPALRAIGSG